MNRGAWGEKIAATYLESKGYTVQAQNYRSRWGEIDLIMASSEWILFVEVKTRATNRFGQAREAVTKSKQRKLIETAWCWIAENPLKECQMRFDVVEVYDFPQGPKIHYIPNAFDVFDV